MALVQTVDLITPIVDDPYVFGQVTAANALSDIYAMGGKPITAMNLAAFPCELGLEILGMILEGGRSKVEEAGAVVVGGHTIEDDEPKYGLSVTGIVSPDKIMTIGGAKSGDILVLTKPLGVGVLATVLKWGKVDEQDIKAAIDGMIHLNAGASDAMLKVNTHAATDITGFGFLGHLHNMMHESGVSARIVLDKVPIWPQAREYVHRKMIGGGLKRNWEYLEGMVVFDAGIDELTKAILFDPQTSGGLLISVAPDDADKLIELLKQTGTPAHDIVGEVVGVQAGHIEVRIGR